MEFGFESGSGSGSGSEFESGDGSSGGGDGGGDEGEDESKPGLGSWPGFGTEFGLEARALFELKNLDIDPEEG